MNFFPPKNDENGWHNIWFQQDRAMCLPAHKTIYLLRAKFKDSIILRFASCDLTHLDYFLCG